MTFDLVEREVKLIVGQAAWRAYGGRCSVETEVCESCGGDGCDACGGTGEPS